jgi:hypothetical protein
MGYDSTVAGTYSGKTLLVGSVLVAVGLGAGASYTTGSIQLFFSATPYLLAAAGCFAGASAFSSGERMRLAWLSLAVANVFGSLPVIVFGKPPVHMPFGPVLSPTSFAILIAFDILLNIFTVLGLVFFAQVWRSLGVRSRWYPIATLAAFGVGAAVAGPALLESFRHLADVGVRTTLADIISSTGDLIGITMIGPLAVTAFAMRGGALVWPFVFLTAGTVSWLCYDGVALIKGVELQMTADFGLAALGLMLTGAAGIAHRRALRG